MTDDKRVKKLWKKLEKFHKDPTSILFPRADGTHKKLNKMIKDTKKVVEGIKPVGIAFNLLHQCASWKLDYTFYELMEKQNKEEALEMYSQSTACGYLTTKNASLTYGCLLSNEFKLMDTIALYMAQTFIAGWTDKAFEIAEIMIASINYGKVKNYEEQRSIELLIGDGFSLVPASWFMLELYCQSEGRDFDRKKASYPEEMYPYDEALKNWNTQDMTEVEKYVSILSAMHLEQTKEQVTDDDYFEFGDTTRWLFPYEILTWLKLRERAGLKNPKTFTHPLMNTPIAKFFLEMKEPLPKPKELPFAKELLEKLKEKCPDVEIPEWLNETDRLSESEESSTQSENTILPDDFMKE